MRSRSPGPRAAGFAPPLAGELVKLSRSLYRWIHYRWRAHEHVAGPVDGPWAAGVAPAAQKFDLLVNLLADALEHKSRAWTAFTAPKGGGRADLWLVSRDARTRIDVVMKPRSLTLGSVTFALGGAGCGEAILSELCTTAGRFFGGVPA